MCVVWFLREQYLSVLLAQGSRGALWEQGPTLTPHNAHDARGVGGTERAGLLRSGSSEVDEVDELGEDDTLPHVLARAHCRDRSSSTNRAHGACGQVRRGRIRGKQQQEAETLHCLEAGKLVVGATLSKKRATGSDRPLRRSTEFHK